MAISIRILKCMIPGAMCQVSERAKGPHCVLSVSRLGGPLEQEPRAFQSVGARSLS